MAITSHEYNHEHGPTPDYAQMVGPILDRCVSKFLKAAADYGDAYQELGLKGQYSDLHRKMKKLKKAIWDGQPLGRESVEEILEDFFGNTLIALYLCELGELAELKPGDVFSNAPEPFVPQPAPSEFDEKVRPWPPEQGQFCRVKPGVSISSVSPETVFVVDVVNQDFVVIMPYGRWSTPDPNDNMRIQVQKEDWEVWSVCLEDGTVYA
jgi:hypothetical protein